jgi:hypothetical protein
MVNGQFDVTAALSPGKESSVPVDCFVGPREGLDAVKKRRISAAAGNRTYNLRSSCP